MKKITGRYRVADCEHWGDMESAKNWISSLGCFITDSHWDGRDCGEAWIEFWFYDNRFVSLYNKIGCSASFSADINDYLSTPDKLPYTLMKSRELFELKNKMAEDYSAGFEERLPLWFFFEISEYCRYSISEIISKVLSYFKEPVDILGYNIHMTDGNKFCDILIKSSYRNLTHEIMQFGIGDYCLGNRGWLNSNKIYGECQCVHKLINTNKLRGYESIHRVINCIKSGLPIEYRNQDSYYHPKDIIVSSEEYIFVDGSFRNVIERDGKKYYVKDPAWWEWSKPEYAEILKKAKEDCPYIHRW